MLALQFYYALYIPLYVQKLLLPIILIKFSFGCLVKIIHMETQHYKITLIAEMILIKYLIPQSREHCKVCFLITIQIRIIYSIMDLSTQSLTLLTPVVLYSVLQSSVSETLNMAFLLIYSSDHNFNVILPRTIALGPKQGQNFHLRTLLASTLQSTY